MKARKALALFLSVAMTLSLLSLPAMAAETAPAAPVAPAAPTYGDTNGNWAAESIARWSGYGIVKGDDSGNFNPADSITRGELAQVFVGMFGLTAMAENTYGDLKGTEWYADAILKCVAAGIMKGDGVNCNAEDESSRQETMVMFGRSVGVRPDAKPDLSAFPDAANVADWAAGYMAPLAKMGIVTGGDAGLTPTTNIDRASTMALLDKAIVNYVNAPGEVKVDNANGFVVVNVSAKEGEVILSGKAAGVVVSAGTAEGKIVAKDLTAATIKMDGTAALSVEGTSKITGITANATGAVTIAKGVTVDTVTANAAGTITNNGTVKDLVANAAVKVDNKGTITKADVKADGVILDGKKPTTVVKEDNIKAPTDSTGKEIPTVKPGETPKPSNPGSGGDGPSGPSSTASAVRGIRNLKDDAEYQATFPSTPWAGKPTIENVSSLTYTVTGTTIKASGALPHITGFTGFDGTNTAGYFPIIGIQLPVAVNTITSPVIWYSRDYSKSNIGTDFVGDGADPILFMFHLLTVTDGVAQNFKFKVDVDGTGSAYSATEYTVDMSDVVLLAEGVTVGDQATGKIALNAATAADGTNPLTGEPATNVNYKTALSGAGIVYDSASYTLNVNTKSLKAWLTTNAANGDTLAGLMNKDNQKIWAGLKYSAPDDQTHVRVAWDSAAGITGKTARVVADWTDFNDLGTVGEKTVSEAQNLDLDTLQLKNSYDQTMYMLWSTAEGANTATAMTKAVVHVKMNVPVTYDTNGGSSINAGTTPYGEAMTLPAAPTRVGYTFMGWYTDLALTAAFDATQPVAVAGLDLYAKWDYEAAITVMSEAILDKYAAAATEGGDWEGVPTEIATFGTGLGFTANGTTITAAGKLKFVGGFEGFSQGNPTMQNGYYFPLQFAVPSDAAVAPAIIITIGTGENKKERTLAQTDILDGIRYYSVILFRDASNWNAKYPIVIDWDGPDTGSAAKTYSIDFSGVTCETPEEVFAFEMENFEAVDTTEVVEIDASKYKGIAVGWEFAEAPTKADFAALVEKIDIEIYTGATKIAHKVGYSKGYQIFADGVLKQYSTGIGLAEDTTKEDEFKYEKELVLVPGMALPNKVVVTITMKDQTTISHENTIFASPEIWASILPDAPAE